MPAQPVPYTASHSSRARPLSQGDSAAPKACAIPARQLSDIQALKPARDPVGAGLPANTGAAGAMYRIAFFAGTPAPTECPVMDERCHEACCQLKTVIQSTH
ncbi:hypothetical protein D3C76_733140 [compost metagenome]